MKDSVPNHHKLCTLCGDAWRQGQRQHCFTCGLANIIYRDIGTGRSQASAAINREIHQGRLLPASNYHCVDCHKQASDWDHRDYNKPLDVVPVCRSCNRRRGYAIPKRMTFDEFWSLAKDHCEKRRIRREDFEPIRRKYFSEQA